MNNKWDKILLELSYRVSSGIPDLSNEQHLMKLWDILKEHNWNIDARVELIKNLNELDFKNKAELAAYAAKHKIRPTTVVNVAVKRQPPVKNCLTNLKKTKRKTNRHINR